MEHAGKDEWGIGKKGAGEEGEGDGGGDVHTVFLGFAKLRDKSVVWGAVDGHRGIEEDQEDGDPSDVEREVIARIGDWGEEDEDGDDREWDGGPSHERDAAAMLGFAVIGHVRDHWVGDRVPDTAKGGNQTENRQESAFHYRYFPIHSYSVQENSYQGYTSFKPCKEVGINNSPGAFFYSIFLRGLYVFS